MTKKVRVNITVDPDILGLAKSMRLNISEVCNDALKLAVDAQDDKKQILEAVEKKYKEIGMLEQLMEKMEEAEELVNESIGTDEDRMNDAITTLIEANKRRGYVGMNFIKLIANYQNLDYHELIIKLHELPKENKVEIKKFQEV